MAEPRIVTLESSEGVEWWRFWEKEYETQFNAMDENNEPYTWVLSRIECNPITKRSKEIWFWTPYEPKTKKDEQDTAMVMAAAPKKAAPKKAAPKKRKFAARTQQKKTRK